MRCMRFDEYIRTLNEGSDIKPIDDKLELLRRDINRALNFKVNGEEHDRALTARWADDFEFNAEIRRIEMTVSVSSIKDNLEIDYDWYYISRSGEKADGMANGYIQLNISDKDWETSKYPVIDSIDFDLNYYGDAQSDMYDEDDEDEEFDEVRSGNINDEHIEFTPEQQYNDDYVEVIAEMLAKDFREMDAEILAEFEDHLSSK